MMSIAALAQRDGVSKAAVSRKVKQLAEEHGLTVERDGQGRVAGVNVAEYDHLRGRYGDPSKAQAARSVRVDTPPLQPNETYDEALRQKTWIEAERARLKLAEEAGQLLRVDRVADAAMTCGEDVVRSIDRLGGYVDEMAAAVAKDGVHGLRVLVKEITRRLKADVARSLEQIAAGAPVSDETAVQEPAETGQ
jgi:DNA-binding transcriptional ArsR family regulator